MYFLVQYMYLFSKYFVYNVVFFKSAVQITDVISTYCREYVDIEPALGRGQRFDPKVFVHINCSEQGCNE